MAPPVLVSTYRRSLVGLVGLAGTVLSVVAWRLAADQEYGHIRAVFLHQTQTQASIAAQLLNGYPEMVYRVRDAFFGQDSVTRAEFRRVAASLLPRHVGVPALEWVKIVPAADRARWEQTTSAEIGRPVTTLQRRPNGTLQPAPAAAESWVVDYAEPMAGNCRDRPSAASSTSA